MNFELQLARSWQEQLSFKKQTWPEVPPIPPVSPSSANKLSVSLLTSIAGSLLLPWQPTAQPPPFSAASPFCSNHSRFEQRFRQGHRNCSSWTELLGSASWGCSWGKPCCRGWPALQLLSMDKARHTGKFKPAPSHPIILFWLKQTYLWPYSPPGMQSQHLRNTAASESRKPERGNQCCRSESEQELRHSVSTTFPGLSQVHSANSIPVFSPWQEGNGGTGRWMPRLLQEASRAINVQPLLQQPDCSYPQGGLCQILFQLNLILAFRTGKTKKSLHRWKKYCRQIKEG